jgi:diguanylate cyclase (GGDEF)-like protein
MHLSRGEAAEADGVPPRNALLLHVERELGRARRTAAPLAVLLMELEGLAEVRESFGYLTEERLLRAALGSLRDNCREYDYVCRPGGDFLAMAIPGASQKAVRHRTAELKSLVIEAGQKVSPGVALSVRITAASFPEDGESAEVLLACAEQRARQAPHVPSVREAPPKLETIGQGVQ